jgi:hypothetical protein
MATVRMKFIGICTHVLIPVGEWQHRVVLPVPFKTGVPEHAARLHVPKAAAGEQAIDRFANGTSVVRATDTAEHWVLHLRGAELQVLDPMGPFGFEAPFQCGVFKLNQFTNGAPLGNVDREVWDGRKSARAHAYFNVARGMFFAERRGESSAAQLQIPTNGASATLEAKDFSTGRVTTLSLDGAPELEIRHTFPSHDNSHFKLHFELVQTMPKDPTFPEKPAPCLPPPIVPPDPGQGLGAGCSNSQFP